MVWAARILLVLMVLCVAGAYAFRELPWLWAAFACLVLLVVDEVAYRFVRLTGK